MGLLSRLLSWLLFLNSKGSKEDELGSENYGLRCLRFGPNEGRLWSLLGAVQQGLAASIGECHATATNLGLSHERVNLKK